MAIMRINGTLVTSLVALFEFILSVKFHISYNDLVYIVFLRFQRKVAHADDPIALGL